MVCCIILCGVGGIHQRAQAIVGIDDALIGIVIAGLAAVGITFVSTGAYATLRELVFDELTQYAVANSTTLENIASGIQSGANGIGQILVNNRFLVMLQGFATYLIAKYSLTNNGTFVIQDVGSSLAGLTTYNLPISYVDNVNSYGTYSRYWAAGASVVYAMFYLSSSRISPYFFSESPFQVSATMYLNGSPTETVQLWNSEFNDLNGQYKYVFDAGSGYSTRYQATNGFEYYTLSDITGTLLDDSYIDENNIGININTGNMVLPLDDPSYDEDKGAVIDVAAPWGMTYPDIMQRWLPKEWAPGMSGNPTMTYETEQEVSDQVQTGPDTASVSADPGDYAVPGLQSVFPFCLPFDIYNLLLALAADPVAPSFTWRFYVPGICDEDITVDLSPFDTVAQIVRTVELLAFIVGLALVTRERFLRG